MVMARALVELAALRATAEPVHADTTPVHSEQQQCNEASAIRRLIKKRMPNYTENSTSQMLLLQLQLLYNAISKEMH
jgi:hypothetical protein